MQAQRPAGAELEAVLADAVALGLVDERAVRDLPPHDLSYNTTALITTDCDAMRSLSTKWP